MGSDRNGNTKDTSTNPRPSTVPRRSERVRKAARRGKISTPEPGHSLTGRGWQRSTLIGIRRDFTQWAGSEFQPIMVIRTGIGVALAASALPLLNGPGWGMAAILGAWVAGMGLLTPGTRASASVPLLIGAGAALSMLAGSIDPPSLLLAVTAIYALVLTFISTVDKAMAIIVTICGVPFFFADQLTANTTSQTAAIAVMGGAAIQAFMTLLPPYFRYGDDRKYLSTAWRALSADAESLCTNHYVALQTNQLHSAVTQLDQRRRLPPALREARNDIYEVSGALGRVSAARHRALQDGDTETAALHTEALNLASRILLYLANAIITFRHQEVDWTNLLDELTVKAIATPTGTMPGEISGLLRVLHRCDQLAGRISRGEAGIATKSPWKHTATTIRENTRQLAINLRIRNPHFRHSLRRSLIVTGAAALAVLWPGDYGYWLPLTAWLVLQSDFYNTITKGTTRAIGTIAGVLIASGLAIVLPHDLWTISLSVIGFASLAYMTQPVSLALFSVATAALTVMLVDLMGDDPLSAAGDRGLATIMGALIAIGLYSLLPTWQTRRLPNLLADLIDAYSDYARLVLDHQAHPADHSKTRMRAAIEAVRQKRLALTNAAEQAEIEPMLRRPMAHEVMGTETALAKAARALIAIDASVKSDDTAELPIVDKWAQAVDAYYARLAAQVRVQHPLPPPVEVQQASRELEVAVSEGPPETKTRRTILRWEADQVAEGLSDASLIITGWQNDSPGKPGRTRAKVRPADSETASDNEA